MPVVSISVRDRANKAVSHRAQFNDPYHQLLHQLTLIFLAGTLCWWGLEDVRGVKVGGGWGTADSGALQETDVSQTRTAPSSNQNRFMYTGGSCTLGVPSSHWRSPGRQLRVTKQYIFATASIQIWQVPHPHELASRSLMYG